MEQSDEDKEFDRYLRIRRITDPILLTRDEAVSHRTACGVETRWREDTMAFEGIDGTVMRTGVIDSAMGEFVPKHIDDKPQSRVVVNIVRSKSETAEGEFCEIMLPVDDKNWGFEHTPIPEPLVYEEPEEVMPPAQPMPQQGMMQGPVAPAQPMPQQGMVQGQLSPPAAPPQRTVEDKAKKATAAMELEIDDQLTECQFNGESRKVARQSIILGTGVLKGPLVVKQVKKSWQEVQDEDGTTAHVLKIIEESKPASKCVDIWNCYPDPHWDGTPGKMSYHWERDNIIPRDLRKLIGVPGYDADMIRKILDEEPMRAKVTHDRNGRQTMTNSTLKKGMPYEMWEYHGDADKELLELMGCDCAETRDKSVSICAVFVNEKPIKVMRNTLDTNDIPYDYFQWVECDNSPWGIGEPRKMLWQYKVINAAWRMMMNNSGDSAGAQIIMSDDVEPEDEHWDFRGRKFWIYSGDGSVRDAFGLFQVQNNQTEYQRIIELALKFTDLETGTPMMAQGEKDAAPETFRGMEMLMQNARSPRRRKVKQWDDRITRPHLTRYYDWNMQYNPKNEIKGDMHVDPRGTSVLLVKDQNVQQLLQLLQLRGDPEVNIMTDWGKVIKQLFEASHLDVMKSDDEIEQARAEAAQNPPQNPALQVAQIRSETDMQKAQLTQESDMAEIQAKAQATQAEMAAKLHMMEQEQEHELQLKEIEREIEMMKLAAAQQISLESIKASLAGTAAKLQTQKELSYSNQDHARTMETMKPPTEPAGRADTGHSFEQ